MYWWNLNHYKSKQENRLDAGDKARKPGFNPGFETQGRRHQKSKIWVPVAQKKGRKSRQSVCSKKEKREEKRPYLPPTL